MTVPSQYLERYGRPPRPVNHGLHLALTLFTAGIWALPYVVIVVNHGREMRRYRDIQIMKGPA